MMNFTCETIGLTEEELQDRVVQGICQQLLTSKYQDYEEGEYIGSSALMKKLSDEIERVIDVKVAALADREIRPNVDSLIENLVIQKTNQYGEKKGEPVTFIEYLTHSAESYMTEKVNYEGKTKKEGGYGWSAKQDRLMYLVDKNIQYSIDTALKEALKGLTNKLSGGLDAYIRNGVKEFMGKLKVAVK